MKKQINFFFALLLLTISTACNESTPDYVIDSEKMEIIMTDLYLADGAAIMHGISSGDSTKYALYNGVLAQHQVTLSQFDSSLTWYAAHLDEFEKINQNVFDRLNQMREDANK